MNLSLEYVIDEIINAVQNEYNFASNHYNNIKQLIQNIFESITETSGKTCKFMGKYGNTERFYYNIAIPYIIAFLSKYTDFHIVCVFETIYVLERFKNDLKLIKNKLIIESNHRFKLTFTTIHRVKTVCCGITPDIVFGWMPMGNLFGKNFQDTLTINRSNVTLVIIGNEYLDNEVFEVRINLILRNGFKIRL